MNPGLALSIGTQALEKNWQSTPLAPTKGIRSITRHCQGASVRHAKNVGSQKSGAGP